MEKKKDRRKQDKPQKSEDPVQEVQENEIEENLKEEADDFSNDPDFDQSAFMNDDEYDPYSDEPRRLR